MSLEPMLWALKDAPLADTEELGVLVALAESADEDGCDAYPSKPTIARYARLSEKTVQRRLAALQARGLIAKGDQRAAARIPADKRPVVYDLMIPYAWYGPEKISRVQAFRAAKGRPALTPEGRPPLGPPPPPKRRSDYGMTKEVKAKAAAERGDYKTPRDSETPRTSEDRGVYETPRGGSTSPGTGGLVDPQTTPLEKPTPSNHPNSVETSSLRADAGATADTGDPELYSGLQPGPAGGGQPGAPAGDPQPGQQAFDGTPPEALKPGPWLREIKKPDPRWPALVAAQWVCYRWWSFLDEQNTPAAANGKDSSQPFMSLRSLVKTRLERGYSTLEIQNAMLALYKRREPVLLASAQQLDGKLAAARAPSARGDDWERNPRTPNNVIHTGGNEDRDREVQALMAGGGT